MPQIFLIPGQDLTMCLGSRAVRDLLAVGVADADGDNPQIIRYMTLRNGFMTMLPQGATSLAPRPSRTSSPS